VSRFRVVAYTLIGGLVVGTLANLYLRTSEVIDFGHRRAEVVDSALEEANRKIDLLGEQIRQSGEEPVVPTDPVEPGEVEAPAGIRYVPVPGRDGTDGEDGQPGEDGKDGAPGAVGPMGPGPTVDQILSAIATYCEANGGCRGESVKGDRGEQGRGIEAVECNDDSRFVIRYDDGSEQVIEDSRCRLDPLPIEP
jgi:hypothetical protein